MARKRMIDPEIWDSALDKGWTAEDFLVMTAAISTADDEGRGRITTIYKTICSMISEKKFQNSLKNLEDSITIYQKIYFFLPKFLIYQTINRPKPSKYPPPSVVEKKDKTEILPKNEKLSNIENNDLDVKSSLQTQGKICAKSYDESLLIEVNLKEINLSDDDVINDDVTNPVLRPDIFSQFMSKNQTDSYEFISAWTEWIDYKRDGPTKLNPKTAQMQLQFLSGKTIPESISIIKNSITNGWSGLDYGNNNGSKNNQQRRKDYVTESEYESELKSLYETGA